MVVHPPKVTYEEGQLTVIAENSLLSDVMKALQVAFGADIELPPNVRDQHIWVRLGPGPARRVLRDLLDGTEFNYVIQASENDADGIRSVMLTPRGNSNGADAVERPTGGKAPRNGYVASTAAESAEPSSEPVAPNESPQTAANEPSRTAANEQARTAANEQAPAAPPANQSSVLPEPPNTPSNSDNSTPSASSKTDQMIQDMVNMFQQRRQIQIQQNQKTSQQAPNQ